MFASLADAETATADLKIHKLSVPTPFPGLGKVNFYFIEDSRPALIDTGMDYKFTLGLFGSTDENTEGGRDVLDHTLAELGYSIGDIARIYLTHGHPDHMGQAAAVVNAHVDGLPVYIHEGDMRYALPMSEADIEEKRPQMLDFMLALGAPEETLSTWRMMREAMEGNEAKPGGAMRDPHGAEPLREVLLYDEGDMLEFDRFTMTVLHTPGHTAGQVCLHEPAHKLLFVGDHILPETSPIALPDFGSSDLAKGKLGSLLRYINNVRRVEAMDVDIIYPGHGDYILDHRNLIKSLFKFYDKRQRKILGIIDKLDEPTTYDVAKEMFPELNPMMAFLAMTEAAGHLEVLEERGAVEAHTDRGPLRYRTTG